MRIATAVFCLMSLSLSALATGLPEYGCKTTSKFGTMTGWVVAGLTDKLSVPIGHTASPGSQTVVFTTFSKDGQIYAQIIGLDSKGSPADVGFAVKVGEPLNMNSSDRMVEVNCVVIP